MPATVVVWQDFPARPVRGEEPLRHRPGPHAACCGVSERTRHDIRGRAIRGSVISATSRMRSSVAVNIVKLSHGNIVIRIPLLGSAAAERPSDRREKRKKERSDAQLITASANHTLDALLELVCVRIQLSPTQDGAARQHYDAVTEWLSREGSPVRLRNPTFFHRVSAPRDHDEASAPGRIRPRCGCLLDIRHTCHPGAVYRLVWDRLWDSGVYRPMMKRLPRCIRLEYAGDFHLDIAPAVPDLTMGGNCILVPDLDANLALDHPENDEWKSTNPQDYADWFEDRCVKSALLIEKYAPVQVDPVPKRNPSMRSQRFKRSVQLIKRWRDVEYSDRPIAGAAVDHLDHAERATCTGASRSARTRFG